MRIQFYHRINAITHRKDYKIPPKKMHEILAKMYRTILIPTVAQIFSMVWYFNANQVCRDTLFFNLFFINLFCFDPIIFLYVCGIARTGGTNIGINSSFGLVREVNQEINDPNQKTASKSFIQQRVERLYGPTALTQGLYSPKKVRTSDEHFKSLTSTTSSTTTTATTIASTKQVMSSVLVEKSQNVTNTFQSTKYVLEAQRNGYINALQSDRANDDENISLGALNEALPVLRHLRPEFRAQLPTLSPKRTIAISKLKTAALQTTTAPAPSLQTTSPSIRDTIISQPYENGTTNGKRAESGCTVENITFNSQPATNCIRIDVNRSSNQHDSDSTHSNASILSLANNMSEKCGNGCLTSNKNNGIESNVNILSQTESINKVHSNEMEANATNPTNMVNKMNAAVDDSAMIGEQIQCNKSTDSVDRAYEAHNAKIDTPNSNAIILAKSVLSATSMDANGNLNETEPIKDARYFLNTVHAERDRLIALADDADTELEQLVQVILSLFPLLLSKISH